VKELRRRHPQAHDWVLVISLALMFGFVGLNRAGTSLGGAISAWLSGCVVLLGVPETAPRVLARREPAPGVVQPVPPG
jgi:hypothetical protein